MTPQRPVDGLLLVDKQQDLTSHDVVAIARRRLAFRKIGHTGTLDPKATGLLVLCLGSATRLQAYLMGMDKTYEGTIRFGWETDTYDAEGQPVGEPVERSIEGIDFEPWVAKFRGKLEQLPPAFSAKKIHGVRAYKLARKGKVPELAPREVEVFEFEITRTEGARAHFRIRSSAGTYVRSIAHDLGRAAGIPAHLGSLRRIAIGEFGVEAAVPSSRLAKLVRSEILESPAFIALGRVRLSLESVLIDPVQERRIATGQTIVVRFQPAGGGDRGALLSLISLRGELFAIGEVVEAPGAAGGLFTVKPKVVLVGTRDAAGGAEKKSRGGGIDFDPGRC